MFISNGARPVVVRPALRFVSVSRFLFIRLEPVGTLPTGSLAELTAQIAQAVIRGRKTLAATREALLTGIMDVIVLGIRFNGASDCVTQTVVIGAKAAHIETPDIPLRMPINDPLRHGLADPARARQAMRAEGTRHPETFDRGRAQQELAIRQIGRASCRERV